MKTFTIFMLLCLAFNNAFSAMHKEELVYKHGETELKGYVFWDDAFAGQRPGVLVLPEQWGMSDYVLLRAEMLAESGYVAFAADLYGNARVTRKEKEALNWKAEITQDVELLRERAKLGFDQLFSHEKVDTAKTAAIGYSLGGTTALQLAFSGVELGGIVSVHGALPATALIEAKKVRAKLLLLHGDDDQYVSKDNIHKVTQTLSKAGVDWELNIFGRAKHAFSNPYADGYGITGFGYQIEADQRSWKRILSFLESLFEEEFLVE